MIGVTFGEIEVGMEHTFVAKADMQLVRQFAMVSGDRNPTHLDEDFALSVGLDAPVIHKMIIPMILSEYFGNTFPGPGTGWRKQELEFLSPVFVGEQLIILLEVLEKEAPQKVVIGVTVKSYKGHVVAKGIETLDAPLEHYPVKPSNLPFFYLPDRHVQLAQLISRATRSRPPSMAVAWPHNNESLQGAVDAMNKGLVVPVFFGIREKIVDIASDLGVDITNIKIVDASDEVTACDMAARAVGRDEIDILAKGSPHSDTFLRAILSRESNMRIQGGHLSHVFYVDGIPPRHGETKPRSIVITDGALNIQPTLQEKAKITQNAIDFLHSMGVEKPRVAALAAVEVVNHGMSVTLDAAALTVMAQRGQITGAYVDGPMAMDLATNPEAAKAKGFVSEVAGRADILLCPTIEAGNIAAKEYEQMNVLMAGVLCGTKKPVVLTSRSDDSVNRLAAIAIACILLGIAVIEKLSICMCIHGLRWSKEGETPLFYLVAIFCKFTTTITKFYVFTIMKRLLEVRGYSAVSLLSFLRVFSIWWVRSVQLLLALFALLILFVVLPSTTQADFAMGAYSQDNSIDEFIDSEKKFDFTYQVIGFTFDTFTEADANHLELAIKKLGSNRVYHVTISPFGYSAKQVAEGEYDAAYRRFFALAKKSETRFIFRTMHEMNGSWYSWSGDPYNFKKAWKRVYEISRKEGIDASKVLFVFSSNSQDLPSENGIINGTMIFCTPAVRAKNNCIAMEDYYPGSEYVDLMGITLYNWGRGKSESWSKWTSFEDLLLEPRMQMFERMKLRGHPIIIDEVGTTAVDFQGTWSNEAVIEAYLHGEKRKNEWIRGMQATLKNHTEIVAAVYFNRDKTYGLMDRSLIGELDWSVSSTKVGKVYTAFFDIFKDTTVSTRSLPFLPSYSLTEAKTLASQKAKETLIGIRSYKNNSKKRATMIENIRKKYQVEQTKLDAMGATAKNIKMQTYWKNVLSEYRKIVDAELKSKSK